jgi:hypothetical protein
MRSAENASRFSRFKRITLLSISLLALLVLNNCGSGNNCKPETNLDIDVCDPANGPFSTEITNPYLPFAVGSQKTLEGVEGGNTIRLQITVLDETETVAGIDTQVVEEREWENDELIEVSRNFFVQAPDGTVCYYGEEVDIYEDGVIVSHEGAWRAGEDDNLPGIMMPGSPAVGQIYAQESAPGIAEDTAEITAIGDTVTVPAGTFTDTITTVDTNPFDCSKDQKNFARTVGLIRDAVAELLP